MTTQSAIFGVLTRLWSTNTQTDHATNDTTCKCNVHSKADKTHRSQLNLSQETKNRQHLMRRMQLFIHFTSADTDVAGHNHRKSDWARPYLCKLAQHGPWPVQKQFIRDHVWRGRSKWDSRIVGCTRCGLTASAILTCRVNPQQPPWARWMAMVRRLL